VRARRFVKFAGSLNYSASQLVNFAKMKYMILSMDENETVIVCTQNKIKRKRDRGGVSIISQPEEKTYRVSFEVNALE